MPKHWKENPPGEEQKILEQLFSEGLIDDFDTPSKVWQRYPEFQEYSEKVFSTHFRSTKAKMGLIARGNRNDDSIAGVIPGLGPIGPGAVASPSTSRIADTGIQYQNAPYLTWMYTDHIRNYDFVCVAIPMIGGCREINFNLSDDGQTLLVNYIWPTAIYSTEEMFHDCLNGDNAMSVDHPKIHAFTTRLLECELTLRSKPKGVIQIALPVKVQREVGTYNKAAVKSKDTKIVLLEFQAFQKKQIINDADTEVFKALNKTRGLYLRWREIGDTSVAESEWTTTELRNSLRSIEWDLEDLEDTITIVEKNPNKFKIDKKELISRRCFIDATRDEVKSMKEKMSLNRNRDRDITARQPLLETVNNESNNNQSLNNNSSGLASTLGTMASRHSGTKYSKLENAIDSPGHYSTLDSPSHRFVGESVSVQQRMLQGQDEQLDVISDSIGTLKTVSRQIGIELDEQAVMLDDFGNELESTESKIDSTMKKVAKVLNLNNDNRQWMAIIVLSILLLLVIVLFIVL